MAACNGANFAVRTGVLLFALFYMVKSDETCDIEIENTLRALLTPEENPSIQLLALRKDLLRRFQELLQQEEEEKSLNSLSKFEDIHKRNLEALARAGLVRTLPSNSDANQEEEDDANFKRSIANLAKNGQLPNYQNPENKRGIESLARNGELHRRKDIQELIDDLYDKRNIGSLARNYNFPSYGKRFIGSLAKSGDLHYNNKRNVASLARDGTRVNGKRNVAALLRQDNYMNEHMNNLRTETPQIQESDKRNLASIKAQYSTKFKRDTVGNVNRQKRQVDYYEGDNEEYPVPVYQNNNVYDYEELMKALTGVYPNSEKRFLGRLPQMGKPKTTPPPKTRFH